MREFFAKYPDAGAGARAREQALETVQNNIKWLSKNTGEIEQWLKQHGFMWIWKNIFSSWKKAVVSSMCILFNSALFYVIQSGTSTLMPSMMYDQSIYSF